MMKQSISNKNDAEIAFAYGIYDSKQIIKCFDIRYLKIVAHESK